MKKVWLLGIIALGLGACSPLENLYKETYRIEFSGNQIGVNTFSGSYTVDMDKSSRNIDLGNKNLPASVEFVIDTTYDNKVKFVQATGSLYDGGDLTIKVFRNGKLCKESSGSSNTITFAESTCYYFDK